MSEKKQKPRGLGRGLSALMADIPAEPPQADRPTPADRRVPIEDVHPNPDQPRRQFSHSDLEDLAASIAQKGILQPIVVRKAPDGNGFQIVAGERRWRAAQIAQLHDVPVIERELTDTEVLEFAIIENIQRSDLTPIEEAVGYQQLMQRFGHTQEKLSEALGKSRSHIANLLRLLQLPDDVRQMVNEGQLSAGHARALITTENPTKLAREVIAKGLSVRDTEKLAKGGTPGRGKGSGKSGGGAKEKDADTKALEADLAAAIGMGVSIDHSTGGESGTLTIRYASLDQLDDLCRVLAGG